MADAASSRIETGVIEVLKNVSRRPIEPSLSSDLVADLGFDSLQVLEVVAELEDTFDISIPLNDVPATRTVAPSRRPGRRSRRRARQHVMPASEDAVGRARRGSQPAAPATPSSSEGGARTRSYAEIRRSARSRRRAACDAPACSAATSSRSSSRDAEQFLTTLIGAAIAGIVPASLYPPSTTTADMARFFEATAPALAASGARAIVTTGRSSAGFRGAASAQPEPAGTDRLACEDARSGRPSRRHGGRRSTTSRSFSTPLDPRRIPKGVVVTHRSLAANIDGIHGPSGLDVTTPTTSASAGCRSTTTWGWSACRSARCTAAGRSC